ncbi:MAG: acyl-ACP--UDP-N-acetylglucosamine O-acyltransferase [Rhodospirillales bacterium]|nr:acyl-ACP--UDP-N-acetylglucosamine O-acyltransferase [Rhodospirillales bacterium]
MAAIHSSAIVAAGAKLGEGVEIGPFCVVGAHVELGASVKLHSHVVVEGHTTVGARCSIFPFASIGHQPQDLKFKGEPSRLEIGEDTIIREHVTMNPGTAGGGLLTKVGSRCLIMVGSHVAHDCKLGNNVILANNATLGGHVVVEDFAFLGGLCAVHQFVRIGRHAMVGGMSGVENDVIPYGSVMGDRARLGGLNLVGLKRRGFSREDIHSLRTAYRLLFAQEGTMAERIGDVAQLFSATKAVQEIVDFIKADSQRALCQPRSTNGA